MLLTGDGEYGRALVQAMTSFRTGLAIGMADNILWEVPWTEKLNLILVDEYPSEEREKELSLFYGCPVLFLVDKYYEGSSATAYKFGSVKDILKKEAVEIGKDGHSDGFWHENIFEAVYCTNLLMRSCDVLVTKPSELAFYPVPKLFIRRVGKHEMWGAIHSAEIGDGTLECRDLGHTVQMLDLFMQDRQLLADMCHNIMINKSIGIYDGAYHAVKLAMDMKK